MEIVISRHARRRLQLYSIREEDVLAILERGTAAANRIGTRGFVIDEASACRYGFPLKIVYEMLQAQIIVSTAYPLKKGASR